MDLLYVRADTEIFTKVHATIVAMAAAKLRYKFALKTARARREWPENVEVGGTRYLVTLRCVEEPGQEPILMMRNMKAIRGRK